MGNEGVFELGLLDVRGQPARDLKVRVSFFRTTDSKLIRKPTKHKFPPNRRFRLPAFPQERILHCQITPSRFRQRTSGFFTLTDGETLRRELTVFRIPSKWNARFKHWNQLPNHFRLLKCILEDSPSVRVRGGRSLGRFTGANYDTVTDRKTILAKSCLLNLFAKLTVLEAPTTTHEKWFSFVREIVSIGQERFIALVDPRMGRIVRRIKDDIGNFKDYKHTPAGNHHKNMPKTYTVPKSRMFSIKSREDHGNIQLTLAPATDPQGENVLLLDADIDENGRLFGHLFDVFKHKFTGGTQPFDIHEYLAITHPNVPLGYELV